MNDAQVLQVAQRVLAVGRKYREGWCDDGTPESGPSGGTTPTVAWGQLRLYVSRNGSVHLARYRRDGQVMFYTVFGSYLGSGHWGMRDGVFWCDEARKAIGTAIEKAVGK